jgi:3'(2'), 5'-bisphosphate nucleotidase
VTLNITLQTMEQIGEIAKDAGEEIMRVYNTDFAVEEKPDASPVTEADRLAEALITHAIKKTITGQFPIIAEEAFSENLTPETVSGSFWLVDPLDGTKSFVKRSGEFTVNIALIENGVPIVGVVHAPAIKTTYWGGPHGAFAEISGEETRQISCRASPKEGLTALVSRFHSSPEMDEYLSQFKIKDKISSSSSLKFCLLAEGKADIYPRLGRTMEWDTAAGHAVLSAAGGQICDLDGASLRYGKPGFENPHFVAKGGEKTNKDLH